MRRAWVAMIGGLVVFGAVAAIAMAQGAAPPVVPVAVTPTSAVVQATGPVAGGPTTFRVTRPASRQGLSVYFLLPLPGVTLAQVQAALKNDDRTQGDSVLGIASIRASVDLPAGQTTRDVTFALQPGATYIIGSEPQVDDGPPPTRGFATFTTSAALNGATAPAPAATVRMVSGLRFRGNATLPRQGTIRVRNESGGVHIAIAFPLRRGVTASRLGRALRTNSQRAFGRVLAGEPVTVSGGQSGVTEEDQQVRFSRAGKWALICFVDEHQRLGMYRVVTVR